MSRLSVVSADKVNSTTEQLMKEFTQRIVANPPGVCPVDMQLAFLKVCHAQTCGKCVPCRVGLGQLERLLEKVLDNEATMETLELIEETAENIKKELAYAIDPEEKTMQICGRNMVVGLPQMLELSSAFVYDAIKEQLGIITDAIKTILERTPPELGVDIIANGIYLTGGSARIRNLDLLLQKKTGISVKVDEDPEMCVVRGLARVINEKEFRPLAFVTKEQKYV